jgi:hypothetical protein
VPRPRKERVHPDTTHDHHCIGRSVRCALPFAMDRATASVLCLWQPLLDHASPRLLSVVMVVPILVQFPA